MKPAMKLATRNTCRGFTLIELLVVISIISLLVAILLPVLAKARQSAMNLVCHSSHKQMWLSYSMYSLDNKDKYYPAENVLMNSARTVVGDNHTATWQGTSLIRTLVNMQYTQGTLTYAGTADTSYVTQYVSAGRCPTASDNFVITKHYISLGYNSTLGQGYPYWVPNAANAFNPNPYKSSVGPAYMPGANASAVMSGTVTNYLAGINTGVPGENFVSPARVGIYRIEDIYKPIRTSMFFDSIYSNRMNPSSGHFGAAYASYLLHPGIDAINTIFVDGHVDTLTQERWTDKTINWLF